MSGEEDFRDTPALVFGRTSINGSRQKVVLKGIGEGALFVADDAWNNTHDSVGHHGCCQFAACQHIITDADFLGDQVLADAVVDTFIMSSKDDDVLAERQLVGHGLVKLLAIRRGEDNLVVVALGREGADTAVDRLTLHDHPGKTAKGIVIDATVLADSIVAQVMQMDFYESFLLGASQNTLLKKTLDQLRDDGDDINTHG